MNMDSKKICFKKVKLLPRCWTIEKKTISGGKKPGGILSWFATIWNRVVVKTLCSSHSALCRKICCREFLRTLFKPVMPPKRLQTFISSNCLVVLPVQILFRQFLFFSSDSVFCSATNTLQLQSHQPVNFFFFCVCGLNTKWVERFASVVFGKKCFC